MTDPATVAVTIWYAYGQQSVTYRYTLSDAFLPTTSSADWSNGYQRLLLPEEYTGVTQIDLTIETVYAARGTRARRFRTYLRRMCTPRRLRALTPPRPRSLTSPM